MIQERIPKRSPSSCRRGYGVLCRQAMNPKTHLIDASRICVVRVWSSGVLNRADKGTRVAAPELMEMRGCRFSPAGGCSGRGSDDGTYRVDKPEL